MKQSTLLISLLSIVSASDCSVVIGIWKSFSKSTNADTANPIACCSGDIPGVSCEGSNVVEIDWRRQGLNGEIPSDIGALVNLRQLYLGANKITGNIPSSIENLKSLKILDLGYNRITSIPDAIGGLTNLEELILWYNRISGSIPQTIGLLSKIRGVFLGNNQLSGEVPVSFSDISNVTVADFRKNPNLGGAVKARNADIELGISGTNITVCQDGQSDPKCQRLFPSDLAVARADDLADTDSVSRDESIPEEKSEQVSNNSTSTTNDTLTTGNGGGGSDQSNGYIVGGLVGASGLVATTMLIIFRTPKSVKSELDESPDLESVTEENLPDAQVSEVGGDLVFAPADNPAEAGPSAADIEAAFPSIFSNIMGDINKE